MAGGGRTPFAMASLLRKDATTELMGDSPYLRDIGRRGANRVSRHFLLQAFLPVCISPSHTGLRSSTSWPVQCSMPFCSQYHIPHAAIWYNTGSKLRPSSVSEYSTFGGTCA